MQREGEEKRAVHCCWRIVFVSLYPWKAHTGARKKIQQKRNAGQRVCKIHIKYKTALHCEHTQTSTNIMKEPL